MGFNASIDIYEVFVLVSIFSVLFPGIGHKSLGRLKRCCPICLEGMCLIRGRFQGVEEKEDLVCVEIFFLDSFAETAVNMSKIASGQIRCLQRPETNAWYSPNFSQRGKQHQLETDTDPSGNKGFVDVEVTLRSNRLGAFDQAFVMDSRCERAGVRKRTSQAQCRGGPAETVLAAVDRDRKKHCYQIVIAKGKQSKEDELGQPYSGFVRVTSHCCQI